MEFGLKGTSLVCRGLVSDVTGAYMPRQFRPSVRPSVTRVYCIKTAERIIEVLSLSDRSVILVFRHQGLLRKSDGFTPNGGAEYKGVAIFDQYAAVSRKRWRHKFDFYRKCALSNF